MDKNIILAFVFSTVIIIGYYLVFPPPAAPPTQEAPVVEKTEVSEAEVQQDLKKLNQVASEKIDRTTTENQESKIIVLESELYQAKINTKGGVLESFILKDYAYSSKPRINLLGSLWNLFWGRKNKPRVYDPERRVQMINPSSMQEQKLPWEFFLRKGEVLHYQTEQESEVFQGEKTIILRAWSEDGILVEKRFVFDAEKYIVQAEISAFNDSDQRLPLEPSFVIGLGGELNEVDYQARPTRFAIYEDNDLDVYDGGDFEEAQKFAQFDWLGLMDIYFIQALKAKSEGWSANLSSKNALFNANQTLVPFLELESEKRVLNARENWQQSFEIFIGPKKKEQMQLFSKTLEQSLDLTFDFLGQPMLIALRWFYQFIPNWGVAIILLTILVRLIIFPLTYKGMKGMKKMSALGPKIQALKKKYGDNKEKFNKEMMEVYKKHKVNPLGGCLPLLLQIPIFIALYSALIPAIELRHSKFIFWIQDLSQSDFTYVLPILMGASMYLQQKLTPMSTSMDATQQKIFRMLPLVMTFFFLNFPASLVLYWLISNIIGIGQQQIINRIKIEEVPQQTVQEKRKNLKKAIKKMSQEQMKRKGKRK